MREVVALEGLSRPDWLAYRRQGIGSSDVAAIVGVDRFRGPFDVYTSKVAEEDGDGGTMMMRLGQHLEDGIARAYAQETGSEVTKPTHMYAHDEHPWMLANVDRFTDNAGTLGVLEVKLSSRYEEWDEGPPQGYELQCAHQLAVTGLDYADLVALLGGRELRTFRIDRDDALISNLIEIEAAFWEQVEARIPPPVDARSSESLKRLYRDAIGGVEVDPSIVAVINELRIVKASIKVYEEQHEELANTIKAAIGDAEVATVGGVPVATWSKSVRSGFDRARLEADHPRIAMEYVKSTPVRTLRLKKEYRP